MKNNQKSLKNIWKQKFYFKMWDIALKLFALFTKSLAMLHEQCHLTYSWRLRLMICAASCRQSDTAFNKQVATWIPLTPPPYTFADYASCCLVSLAIAPLVFVKDSILFSPWFLLCDRFVLEVVFCDGEMAVSKKLLTRQSHPFPIFGLFKGLCGVNLPTWMFYCVVSKKVTSSQKHRKQGKTFLSL